jgi:hypothetical protein
MTRSHAVALVAALAVVAFACFGCEGTPDASAESGTTCAQMSERDDAQCAGNPEACSHDCLHGKDQAAVAAHEGEGCAKSDCTCPHKNKEGCDYAHAAAEKGETAEAHSGCPHARTACSEREPDTQ